MNYDYQFNRCLTNFLCLSIYMLHEGIKVAHYKYNKEIQELEQIMERCLSSIVSTQN